MMTTMTTTALAATAILAVATLTSLLLGKASASLRHLLWTAALAATIALPVLEASGVRVEVPVPAAWLRAQDRAAVLPLEAPDPVVRPISHAASHAARAGGRSSPSSSSSSVAVERTGAVERTASDGAREASVARAERDGVDAARLSRAVRVAPIEHAAGMTPLPAGHDPAGATSETAPTRAAPVGPTGFDAPSIAAIVSAVWLLGTLLLLSAILFGQLAAHRLTTRSVRPAGERVRARLAVLAYETGIRRPVRLVVSSTLRVPATWGLWTSTIVLPEDHRSWTPGTLDRVLQHELAHIHRKDCWTLLVGELARAVHWPNPFIWIAVRRQRLESERACDDRVLARGDVASDYAQDLVGIARSVRAGLARPQAALAMAGPSGVASRIRSILDPACARGRVGTTTVLCAAFLALAVPFSATGIVPVASAQEAWEDVPPAPAPAPLPAIPDLHAVADLPTVPYAADVLAEMPEPPRVTIAGVRALYGEVMADVLSPRGLARIVGQALVSADEQSQEHCVFRSDGGRRSTSYHSDDDVQRIRWETDGCRVEIDMEGRIEFTADDTGIARMADRALFQIEERIGRATRRVRLDGESNGIERRYWVDGDARPWGPEAERWLASLLPEIFRHTTINAEARVRRMLDDRGPDRVFAEVARMSSDHVSATYLGYLIDMADLGERDYVRVIDAAAGFDSDHQTAELLMAVVARAGMRPAFQDPLLRAASSIDSDHQKAMVLQTLLDSDLSPEQWETVLLATRDIESDHQLATILEQVARRDGLSVAGRQAYLRALSSIESDHQQASVVGAFLDAGPLTAEDLSQVLELTGNIESDHQLATVLRRVADEYELTGPQVTAYLRAASRIDSDHQVAETAGAVIGREQFTSEHVQMVLDMANGVESDHQLATILRQVVERRALTPDEIDRVLDAATGIESDHELAEVLKRLFTDQQLDRDGVYRVVQVARNVDSDHEQSEVLIALAGRYELEGEALGLYRDLAERMGGHQRDRTLAAIARRPVG